VGRAPPEAGNPQITQILNLCNLWIFLLITTSTLIRLIAAGTAAIIGCYRTKLSGRGLFVEPTAPPSPHRQPARDPDRPWRKRLRIAGAIIGVLLLLALIGVALVLRRADQALQAIQEQDPRRAPAVAATTAAVRGEPVASPAPLPNAVMEPITVLLVGVDKRPDEEYGVRSDTLILVRIDPLRKWASMLSIPRDSVVNIPHVGQAKINAAFAFGYANAVDIYGAGTEPDAAGGALAAETVEQFLGVKVDYVAQVDFNGFAQLVDAIGGVPIDVARPLLDAEYPTDDYGVERIYIPQGLQIMDGRTALIYARSRHASTDYDRSQRQQQVLHALLDQVRARGLLENAAALPQWADLLAQNVRTTLPVRDLGMINGLTTLARDLSRDRIAQLSINPVDVTLDVEDGSDLYWNAASVKAIVERWQAGPQVGALPSPQPGATPGAPVSAAPETARVLVLNGAEVDGIAGRVSAYLGSRGFDMADPDTAPASYEHTTIVDYSGRPQTRQRLADALGVLPEYVLTQPGPDAPPAVPGADLVVIVGRDYQERWVSQ
jgi:LCP family protein required for cell wall assembly